MCFQFLFIFHEVKKDIQDLVYTEISKHKDIIEDRIEDIMNGNGLAGIAYWDGFSITSTYLQ